MPSAKAKKAELAGMAERLFMQQIELFGQVRYCLCLVFPLPSWLRHCLCLVFLLPSWLRQCLCLVSPLPSWLRQCLGLALLLPSWLRQCLCLAFPLQVNENTNGVLGVGSDSTRADSYYHWGALHALVAIAERGLYPSPML